MLSIIKCQYHVEASLTCYYTDDVNLLWDNISTVKKNTKL
jgi:hypothetical protein